MYRIRKVYWKNVKSSVPNPIVIDDEAPSETPSKGEEFWIRNELYYLKKEDSDILHSESAWLNDRIMDAAQKLIYETHITNRY